METGNLRHNIGLLVVALIAALVGFGLFNIEQARDIGGIFFLAAIVLGLVALVRIAADLLKS